MAKGALALEAVFGQPLNVFEASYLEIVLPAKAGKGRRPTFWLRSEQKSKCCLYKARFEKNVGKKGVPNAFFALM